MATASIISPPFKSSSSTAFLSSYPHSPPPPKTPSKIPPPPFTRRAFSTLSASSFLFFSVFSSSPSSNASGIADFFELERSGGVKALDLRQGDGEVPVNGDQVHLTQHVFFPSSPFALIKTFFQGFCFSGFLFSPLKSHLCLSTLELFGILLFFIIYYYSKIVRCKCLENNEYFCCGANQIGQKIWIVYCIGFGGTPKVGAPV